MNSGQTSPPSGDRSLPPEPAGVPTKGPAPWARWFVAVMIVLTFGVWMAWRSLMASVASPAAPLPVVAAVPAFRLTERSGRDVTAGDLQGTVWIANFIFTTCAGPCPELTLRARSLQESLRSHGAAVKIVTFSVDPTNDTPAVLARYADRYHADRDFWWFLTTNEEATMQRLIVEGFLQTVLPEDHEGPVIHSTYFVVVDKHGRLRAFHNGLEAASKPRIIRDVKSLLREE